MEIRADPDEPWVIRLPEAKVLVHRSLRERGGSWVAEGVTIQLAEQGTSIVVSASDRKVLCTSPEFAGWSALVPPSCRVRLRFDFKQGLLDITALAGNPASIQIRLVDGALLQMPAGVSGRLDVMRDLTYVFSGQNPPASGGVTGQDREGEGVYLNASTLPLAGGPEVEITDTHGYSKKVRLSPALLLSVTGKAGQECEISVGDRRVRLASVGAAGGGGGGGGSQVIDAPNGARVTVSQNSAGNSLIVQVNKGEAILTVDGLDGYAVVGLTGQKAEVKWNLLGGWFAVDNRSSDQTLVVGLPNGASAGLGQGGGGQFSWSSEEGVHAIGRGTGLTLVSSDFPGWNIRVGQGSSYGLLVPDVRFPAGWPGAAGAGTLFLGFTDIGTSLPPSVPEPRLISFLLLGAVVLGIGRRTR